jgi:hypothetical protein
MPFNDYIWYADVSWNDELTRMRRLQVAAFQMQKCSL